MSFKDSSQWRSSGWVFFKILYPLMRLGVLIRVNLVKNLARRRWMEARTAEEAAATCFTGDFCRRRRLLRLSLMDFTGVLFFLDTIAAILESREREGVAFAEEKGNGGGGAERQREIDLNLGLVQRS